MTDAEALASPEVDEFPSTHPDEERSKRARAPGLFWVATATLLLALGLTLLLPRQANDTAAPSHPTTQAAATASLATSAAAPGGIGTAAKAPDAREALAKTLTAQRLAVEQNPRDQTAWAALVDLHDRAGQPREAVHALAALQALNPQTERQRDLVRRHAQLGDERESMRALGVLVQGMQAGQAADHVRLATLLIGSGEHAGAAQTLEALNARDPKSYGIEALNLHVKALLAITPSDSANRATAGASTNVSVDRATQRVKDWLAPGRSAEDAVAATAELARAGHHDRVASLLEPLLGTQAPALVSAWSEAMQRAGKEDLAFRRLASLSKAAGDPRVASPLIAQRVTLALDASKLDVAVDAARALGWAKLPGAVAARLADALLSTPPADARTKRLQARHESVLRELWVGGAQSALGQHDPRLATRAALALSDHASAARWSDAATAACDASPSCAVPLARLHQIQGRNKEALVALKWVDESRLDIDDALLLDYARAAMAAGLARDGVARLDRQRKPTTTPAFDAAWALLATTTGRANDVARWLESDANVDLPADVTDEMFKLALDHRANSVAVALSKRMDVEALRPAQRAMLAQALQEMGRWTDAMPHWQAARKASNAYEDAYTQALDQAVQRGAGSGTQAEWAERIVARVAAAKPGSERDALVQRLVDREAYDKALPWLETLAANDPKRWLKSLEIAADKSGQAARVNAVWRKVVGNESLGTAERLRIGWAMFEGGDKAAADQALRLALVDAGPEDPGLNRLLTVWGPRFTPDQLDWVEARALTVGLRGKRPAAEVAEMRAAWMRRLNEAGGASRTVAVYRRLQPRPVQGPEFDAYVEALTRLGDREALAQALRAGVARKP